MKDAIQGKRLHDKLPSVIVTLSCSPLNAKYALFQRYLHHNYILTLTLTLR